MKIFFAARAQKSFFFFLTRFVEPPRDALSLVCLLNAATPDRLRIRSLQCVYTGVLLLQKLLGRPSPMGSGPQGWRSILECKLRSID